MKVKDLSKKIGFSEQKIYKIKREYQNKDKHRLYSFNQEKDIRKFFVLIKLDAPSKIKNTIEEIFQTFIVNTSYKTHFQINFSYKTYGKTDFIFQISSEEIIDAKLFCNIIKKIFGSDLRNIEIIEILQPFDLFKSQIN